MARRVAFVERDGGLLVEPAGTASGLADVRLTHDCIAALKRLREAGYALVVLVDPARRKPGLDEAQLDTFVGALLDSQGAALEAVARCRHEAGNGCDCALPGIGLVADYVADSELDRRRSLVVGAREESLALARAMGVAGHRLSAETGWADIAHAALDLPRLATVRRRTKETDITVTVDLDRAADPKIATGIGFFDHMLEQLGKHGGFALTVACRGDLDVDEHHTIEDVALAIGQALKEALGDKRGIERYGFLLPMDEAEVQVALDLSGRAYCVFEGDFPRADVGGMPSELVGHFFRSLSDTLGAALHVSVKGENTHHMIEACFKGVARSLRQAFRLTSTDLPSTKGTL